MNAPILELEGTVEEIQERLSALAGQRIHATVRAVQPPDEVPQAASTRKLSITERILAMADEMPADERAQMPPDLAEQHDHYAYGWPKR